MLANLSINVTADTLQAVLGMKSMGQVAQESMTRSSSAVDGYREHLNRAATELQRAAQQMGGSFEAANDAIVNGSKDSEAALKKVQRAADKVEFSTVSEKAAAAFGTAFGATYAATETWLQKTGDLVEKAAIGAAVGFALKQVAKGLFEVYVAYKLVSTVGSFVAGLFSGESYKSPNIDALIAANDKVKAMQTALAMSTQDAQALGNALDRLGVDRSGYVDTFTQAEVAMHTNTKELDRLGVAYEDANGKLLDTQTFLVNVKTALERYTEGYARNAAAAAVGVGSYAQVVAALKVTRAELEQSRQRLLEYGVAIGPMTQAAVDRYQAAMREFNNETELMAQGFKRAMADGVMPMLTDLAEFFREGWPIAVQAYRVGVSTIVGLAYAMKDGIYIVAESILGSLQAIGIGIGGLAASASAALTGNLSGAKDALLGGLEGAWQRFKEIGDNVTAQVMHNDAAIEMAMGKDDRSEPGRKPPKLNDWTPKPEGVSAYKNYLDELDRALEKIQKSEYASMRLKAAQLAEKEGIDDLSGAYRKITAIQGADSQKALDEYTRKLNEQTTAYETQTGALRLTTVGREQLEAATKLWLEAENAIAAAQKSGKPLTDDAITALRAKTAATDDLVAAQIRARDDLTRSKDFGLQKAAQDFTRGATDDAANARKTFELQVKGMEDAVVNFAKTGKLSFKDLWATMAEEFLRQQTRMLITRFTTAGGGFDFSKLLSGLGGAVTGIDGSIASLFSGFFADGGTIPSGRFGIVGENGPELAFGGTTGQTIAPIRAGGAAPMVVQFTGDTIIGSNLSRAEVMSGQRASEARIEQRIRRLEQQGAFR